MNNKDMPQQQTTKQRQGIDDGDHGDHSLSMLEHNNWEHPLIHGNMMKFRITQIDRKVRVVGQLRVSQFEVESYADHQQPSSSTFSLELLEVRPLYDRPSSFMRGAAADDRHLVHGRERSMTVTTMENEEMFEPRVSALFVTKVLIGAQPQLPEALMGEEAVIDHHNARVNQEDPLSLFTYKQQQHHHQQDEFLSSSKFDLSRKTSSSVDVTRVISTASTADIGGNSRRSTPDIQQMLPQTKMMNGSKKKKSHRKLSIEQPFIAQRRSSVAISRRIINILKREESRQYDKWSILMMIWIMNCALILIKGGKTNSGLVPFCGPSYWTVSTASIVLPALASLYIGRYVIRLTHLKLSLDVPFVNGELVYTTSCVFHLLIQTFAAGVAAGVVGIGGGMILGPMMLNEGVSPQVTTAVNSTLVLFASSAAALNFMISGQADPLWASFFFIVCFISSLIGKYVLDRLVKKCNLSSLLVFLLLFIIILSMISMIVSGVLDVATFGFTGFTSPC